jgi:hypothetical protein
LINANYANIYICFLVKAPTAMNIGNEKGSGNGDI